MQGESSMEQNGSLRKERDGINGVDTGTYM